MTKRLLIHLCCTTLGIFFTQYCTAKPISLPDKAFAQFRGAPLDLQKAIDKQPVYLKFWASWCVTCAKEMPHLQQVYTTYGKSIRVIAVNINISEDMEDVTDLVQRHKLTMPIIFDDNGLLADLFDFQGTPYHVLIDSNGDIVYRGYAANTELENKLQLLANGALAALDPGQNKADQTQADKSEAPSLPAIENGVVFYSATWCDWYFKTRNPSGAQNCSRAQTFISEFKPDTFGEFHHYVTYLWTGDEDRNKYQQQYNFKHPITIDQHNASMRLYYVENFPTLLVFNKGKEIFRTTDFSDPEALQRQLNTLSKPAPAHLKQPLVE